MDILSAWLIENTSAIISRGRSSNPIGEKTKYFSFFSCHLLTATFKLMQSKFWRSGVPTRVIRRNLMQSDQFIK